MAKLHHTNVLQLFHVETRGDFRYLEVCEATLSDYCKGDQLIVCWTWPEGCWITSTPTDWPTATSNRRTCSSPCSRVFVCKIAHFRLSKLISASGSFSISLPVRDSLDYMAPEIMSVVESEEANQLGNSASDVFAYLTKGQHPFGTSSEPGERPAMNDVVSSIHLTFCPTGALYQGE